MKRGEDRKRGEDEREDEMIIYIIVIRRGKRDGEDEARKGN